MKRIFSDYIFFYELLERRIDSYNLLIDKFPVIRLDNDSLRKGKRK